MSGLLARLLERDTTLWPDGNVAATRLGWTDIHRRLRPEIGDMQRWAGNVDAGRVVLVGMGGSSLGPEVLRAAVGDDRLLVLDTTDPATVAGVDLSDAFVIVSSKSGGTLEVRALLAHCWDRLPDPARYAAVTDPGTELHRLAEERAFGRVFVNDPDIGGRYSVLSWFGLVPAALAGVDVTALLDAADATDLSAAVELGENMGRAAVDGKDKVTVVVPEPFAAFGLWVEQLIAESTGKQGRGCIPVPTTSAEEGPDRHTVVLDVSTVAGLGAEFLRWEVATAIAGHVLGVDPFDEPNVAESKANTQRVLDALPLPPIDAVELDAMGPWLREHVTEGDYVSLQAYLPYGAPDRLERLRQAVRDGLGGAPVTAGFGPRFLHSTGQLHKGGPNSVVAVQIVPRRATADLPVPGMGFDFGTLIAAQAAGDLESLRGHGRRVLRVAVDSVDDI